MTTSIPPCPGVEGKKPGQYQWKWHRQARGYKGPKTGEWCLRVASCKRARVIPGHFSGVPAGDAEAIKARYRQLASQHHPDKGGDAAVMAAINVEYERVCR